MVTFVWCKLCEKHENAIFTTFQIKGTAETAARGTFEPMDYVGIERCRRLRSPGYRLQYLFTNVQQNEANGTENWRFQITVKRV